MDVKVEEKRELGDKQSKQDLVEWAEREKDKLDAKKWREHEQYQINLLNLKAKGLVPTSTATASRIAINPLTIKAGIELLNLGIPVLGSIFKIFGRGGGDRKRSASMLLRLEEARFHGKVLAACKIWETPNLPPESLALSHVMLEADIVHNLKVMDAVADMLDGKDDDAPVPEGSVGQVGLGKK